MAEFYVIGDPEDATEVLSSGVAGGFISHPVNDIRLGDMLNTKKYAENSFLVVPEDRRYVEKHGESWANLHFFLDRIGARVRPILPHPAMIYHASDALNDYLHENPDVVIVPFRVRDGQRPDGSGIELVREMKRQTPYLRQIGE